MERETREIITPIGKQKVVIFTYLLGGEKKSFIYAEPEKAQDMIIEKVVVSIDGNSDNILERVNNMHGKDYDFIFQEISKVIEDSTFVEKKKK